MEKTIIRIMIAFVAALASPALYAADLTLNDSEYYETRGLNVLVFSNWYNDLFSDSKISGVELIHHGVRTVTNGDVRLSATPGQWDPIGLMEDRVVDKAAQTIDVKLAYADDDFHYTIKSEARGGDIVISVNLDKPLSKALEGKAGFNLEFLPSAYFGKTYLADGKPGVFPLYPDSDMAPVVDGRAEPKPMASGGTITLAPADPKQRVTVAASDGTMSLYDGRNQAQNGWFVLREMLPAGKTGRVLEWTISASTIPGWTRAPVVSYSQVGYAPKQQKIAVVELDKNDRPARTAKVYRVDAAGHAAQAFAGPVNAWGSYLRYNYATFDFSAVRDPGVYVIDYGGKKSAPFPIREDVYADAWTPTLDVYFPVQMDHMFVNEAYRVWHGAAHLDDALQAPINHEHHDLYAQGPTTDTKFKPLEHIPGLNVGGWFDAGDFDIRTQSQYFVIRWLVDSWEAFGLKRDETTIDEKRRYVDMHMPDGAPDILQQIEHGTLQLVAQYDAVGHALNGIVAPDLGQYTHLGDAVTKTDGLIYDKRLGPDEAKRGRSGAKDDRWAFTNKSSALNYGSAAALAAASRALRGYDDALADKAFKLATEVWADEHSHEPDTYRHGNTTGGPLNYEEFTAAVELLVTTHEDQYAERVAALWPELKERFVWVAPIALKAMPYMPDSFREEMKEAALAYKAQLAEVEKANPFRVPITDGGWAGSGAVLSFAVVNYQLHKAFPDIIGEQAVYDGLSFLFGRHPGHNLSLVSGVGVESKKVAYGNNRADFSFIAGGVVPGVLIVKPDLPENKEDWPFFWGENEYVITPAAMYIYLVNAANSLIEADAGE